MTPAMRRRLLRRHHALQDPSTRVRTPNPGGMIHRHFPPFPNNQIPANRFDPGSVYLLDKFAPLPNLPQTGLPNRNYQYLQDSGR